MTQTDTLSPPGITSHLGSSFMYWYYSERPHEIVHSYLQYAHAFSEVFSIIFMLKTLFKPWKSITDSYPTKGFNIGAFAQTLTLNLTSRVIGFIFRLFAMVTALLIQIALIGAFTTYLLVWIVFPLMLISAVPILLSISFR